MEMKINRRLVVSAAKDAAKAIRRSPIPLLSGLLFNVKDGDLSIVGSSSEICIRRSLEVNAEGDFSFAVNAKTFIATLEKVQDEEIQILYNKEKEYLLIEGSGVKLRLPTLDASLWADIREAGDSACRNSVDVKTLKRLAMDTVHALSVNEKVSKLMQSFCVDFDENSVSMMAVDGRRISSRTAKGSGYVPSRVVICGDILQSALALLNEGTVDIQQFKNRVVMTADGVEITASIVTDEYFNLDNIIKVPEWKISVERRSVLNALELIGVFEKKACIDYKDGRMKVSASSELSEAAEFTISASSDEDMAFSAMFDNGFLLDAVRSVNQEQLSLYVENDKTPLYIVFDEDNYKGMEVVLPVRRKN